MTYLERRGPVAIVFGAFALVAVPLVLLEAIPNFVDWLPYAILIEAVGLGSTHFFITLALYFRGENLEYFRRTRANRFIYFVVPATVFVAFGLAAATRFSAREPLLALYVFGGLRVLDFVHVGRQSFGVLQLFKRPLRVSWRWLRRSENAFFVGMAFLQFETFVLGGHFAPAELHEVIPAGVLAMVFAGVVAGHLRVRLAEGPASRIALGYFVVQAVCAAAAVYETRLYIAALAVHYVEYHVLMMARLRAPSGRLRPLDRGFGAIARRPIVLYGALLVVVVLFEARQLAPGSAPTVLFFAHLFDGIFIVHYFVEAFVWRFGNPFFRRTLEPIYFGEAPREGAAPRLSRPPVPSFTPALAAVCAVAVIGVLAVPAARNPVTRLLRHRFIDPLHVENHVVWSMELAEEGQLMDARRHASEAVALDPQNRRARTVLRAIDDHLRPRTGGP